MTNDLERRLAVSVAAAREGASLALPRFAQWEGLEVISKGRQDRVTEVDGMVEQRLRSVIGESFPNEAVLGEEQGLSKPPAEGVALWVIDPIDGTDCFIFGLPMWSISIGCVLDGEVITGVVYDPIHDEAFAAARGHGANFNGRSIRASEAGTLGDGLVGISHSSRVEPAVSLAALNRLLAQGGLFHLSGSGALSLAWVAAGRLLGYFEAHINSWDCLAGLIIVQEAGGWHSDFLSGDWLLQGNPLAVAEPNLVDAMRRVAGEI